MGLRTELQTKLEEFLGSDQVYYQRPGIPGGLRYPCIVYERAPGFLLRSDNGIHTSVNRYTVTFIHRDPDADYPDRFVQWPYCSYDRRFVADNLYHDVFDLYF